MRILDTPVGRLAITAAAQSVTQIRYLDTDENPEPADDSPAADRAARQLNEYFAGRRSHFSAPVSLADMTEFQRQVLDACAAIPAGQTRSYAQIADTIGRPGATRAVGSALRRNPIPILIPCHRVIRGDGQLGAYAGREDARKAALLAFDQAAVG